MKWNFNQALALEFLIHEYLKGTEIVWDLDGQLVTFHILDYKDHSVRYQVIHSGEIDSQFAEGPDFDSLNQAFRKKLFDSQIHQALFTQSAEIFLSKVIEIVKSNSFASSFKDVPKVFHEVHSLNNSIDLSFELYDEDMDLRPVSLLEASQN